MQGTRRVLMKGLSPPSDTGHPSIVQLAGAGARHRAWQEAGTDDPKPALLLLRSTRRLQLGGGDGRGSGGSCRFRPVAVG